MLPFCEELCLLSGSWDGKKTKATNEFWATVQCNFIDIAVLEWLKLFGDHNDKHHWKKIIEDRETFKKEMLSSCKITEDELAKSRDSIKEYRDKFIAHLDSEEVMHIPVLDTPLALVKYYYSCVANELNEKRLRNLPKDIDNYYQECFQAAENHFGK